IAMIGVAFLLWLAEKKAALKKGLGELSWGDAVSIGMAQAVALIPGISRSGITITTGLFRGLTRQAAARFSFLLSAPIMAGAALRSYQICVIPGLSKRTVFRYCWVFWLLSSSAISPSNSC